VLFPQRFWAGLEDGSVTVAFRWWRRPAAKAGGRQRTPGGGELAIDAVDRMALDQVSEADAHAAGYDDRAELLAELERFRAEGADLYRVRFHRAGDDPRLALRDRADLSEEDWQAIAARLDRFDRASPHGPWTATVLTLIAEQPAVRAPDLAAGLGRETAPFKRDVRKLKELGLTISLERGYRLSPRGEEVLRRVTARTSPATRPRTGA
jgi:hypothetical protein